LTNAIHALYGTFVDESFHRFLNIAGLNGQLGDWRMASRVVIVSILLHEAEGVAVTLAGGDRHPAARGAKDLL
jgi:hypothetical protein